MFTEPTLLSTMNERQPSPSETLQERKKTPSSAGMTPTTAKPGRRSAAMLTTPGTSSCAGGEKNEIGNKANRPNRGCGPSADGDTKSHRAPYPPPPPPGRRPNVAERISMLQMAQLRHKGKIVPSGGVRLALPPVPASAAVPAAGEELPVRRERGGFLPLSFWRRNREKQKRNSSNKGDEDGDEPAAIAVRLLDESEW